MAFRHFNNSKNGSATLISHPISSDAGASTRHEGLQSICPRFEIRLMRILARIAKMRVGDRHSKIEVEFAGADPVFEWIPHTMRRVARAGQARHSSAPAFSTARNRRNKEATSIKRLLPTLVD